MRKCLTNRQWWKRGIGSELIGTIAVLLAMVFVFGFIQYAQRATESVRTQVVTDAASDGGAVYGNTKRKFDPGAATQMVTQLLNYNAQCSPASFGLSGLSFYEMHGVVPNKRVTVMDTSVTGKFGINTTSEIIILPKSAHPIALAALDAARIIAADNRYGYGNANDGDNDAFNIDCGIFVCTAYGRAGVPIQYNATGGGGATVAYQYKGMFESMGFEMFKLTSVDELLEGDILINQSGGHTEMYAGNYRQIGAHSNIDGEPGDWQTGREICEVALNSGWEYVFRYVGN